MISQNKSKKKVTNQVAIQTAEFPHIDMAIVVANAAVYTFTRLFQIRIVISNLSLFSLIFLSALDQNLFCFVNHSSL